jgi:large subunit ribosomal protein L5
MIVKEKIQQTFESLKDAFGYTNRMASPRLEKIVISVGTGKKSRTDRDWNNFVSERIGMITGQKPAIRPARASIAGFKIRTGDPIGQMVTLRGERMNGFLEKLIHVALPRTKDFRGVKRSAVDQMGNLTIGIKEHTIFPETSDEELKNVFGMSITLVSTAKTQEEAMAFFTHIGIPFQKEDNEA